MEKNFELVLTKNIMKNLFKKHKRILLIIAAIVVVYFIFFGTQNIKDPYAFTWERPSEYVFSDLNKSAFCNFSKDVNTFYYQDVSRSETEKNIHYLVSNDNGADPVILTDLDTPEPHIRTNAGEAPLIILNNDSVSITLMAQPSSSIFASKGDTVSYELFKEDGILVYTDIHNGLLGPTGTMEMGYCH